MNYIAIPGLVKNIPKPESIRYISKERVIRSCEECLDTTLAEMREKNRQKHICYKRQVTMYLLTRYCRMTLLEVSRTLNLKDHSTVYYAVASVESYIDSDVRIRNEIKEIIENF